MMTAMLVWGLGAGGCVVAEWKYMGGTRGFMFFAHSRRYFSGNDLHSRLLYVFLIAEETARYSIISYI